MSKFLKFIVHFVVICTIVCAAGLILPPFFGVTTEIMTDSKEGNITMSKFLKFIVHFVVICTIVCAAGLILPPFFGVTTEIMTDSKEDTNLPVGSVTYAIPVKATILPPFFGVTTEIMTDSKEDTNLPVGSVTYAIPVKATDIYVGDPILVHEDSKVYRYSVQTLDLENGTGTVVDPSVTNGENITVAVKEYVPKVVFTLSGVGYL